MLSWVAKFTKPPTLEVTPHSHRHRKRQVGADLESQQAIVRVNVGICRPALNGVGVDAAELPLAQAVERQAFVDIPCMNRTP